MGAAVRVVGSHPQRQKLGLTWGRASPSLLPTVFPAPPAQVNERLSGAPYRRAKTGGCFILHSAVGQTVLNPARCYSRTACSCTWEAPLNSCLWGGGGSPLGGLLQPVPLEGSAQTSRRRGHLGRDGANLLITSPEEPLLFASPSPPHPQSLEAQPPWKEEGSPGQTTAGFQREGNTASTKPRLFTCQLSPARRGFFASKFFI